MDDFGKRRRALERVSSLERRALLRFGSFHCYALFLRGARGRKSIQRNLISQVELALRRVYRQSLVECGICTRKVEYILVKLSLILWVVEGVRSIRSARRYLPDSFS